MRIRGLILIVVGCLAAASCGGGEPIETATQRVDEWVEGWNAEDPDAIVAIFTDDATYRDPYGRGGSDKDEIATFAQAWVGSAFNVRRTGSGIATEEGTFVFPVSFDWSGGTDAGEVEVELDGDLVSRLVWLHWKAVDN